MALVDDLHRIKTGGTARGEKLAAIGKRLDKSLLTTAEFERSRMLNIYQKAQLLSAIRQGLAEKGWQSVDIEAISHQILTSRLRPLHKS